MADSNRAIQCRRLLTSLSEESKQAKLKLAQCSEKRITLTQEISSIESRLAALQEELQRKQLLVANAKKEYEECSVRIEYNEAKKIGLCIRYVRIVRNLGGNYDSLTPFLSHVEPWKRRHCQMSSRIWARDRRLMSFANTGRA